MALDEAVSEDNFFEHAKEIIEKTITGNSNQGVNFSADIAALVDGALDLRAQGYSPVEFRKDAERVREQYSLGHTNSTFNEVIKLCENVIGLKSDVFPKATHELRDYAARISRDAYVKGAKF
jgi:hypothetical protein